MLNSRNVKSYIHKPTKGYPNDIDLIVSEEGYGSNPYIETTKKLVVVYVSIIITNKEHVQKILI
jgi:uncharacterized protein (UPF0371 family)